MVLFHHPPELALPTFTSRSRRSSATLASGAATPADVEGYKP
jgi:hypothetical protein